MEDLVSVIIPVYNTKKEYLIQAIESVLNQTYKNIELILVDDGSTTKDAPRICDEYAIKDSRVKVIHQRNSGVSMARNKGLDEATGEYIYFMDNDDWIESNTLKIAIDNIVRTNSDICFFGVKYIFDNNYVSSLSYMGLEGFYGNLQDINSLIAFSWLGLIFNFVTKASCIKNNCRFEKITYEDLLFVITVYSYISSFTVVDIPLYNYRQIVSSQCHTFRDDTADRINMFYNKSMTIIDKNVYPLNSKVVVDRFYILLFLGYAESVFNENLPFKIQKHIINDFMSTDRFKSASKNIDSKLVNGLANKICVFIKKPPVFLLYLLHIYRKYKNHNTNSESKNDKKLSI